MLDKVKAAMKATAVLLPLLGLTWLFGLMAFNRDVIIFKYLFAIFNSLQGLMIFFFHVLFNEQVRCNFHVIDVFIVCMTKLLHHDWLRRVQLIR